MNYANLVQAIKDYTENTEATFVSQIDNFIDVAELRILREVDLNFARKFSTSTVAAGTSFVKLPSDTIVIRSCQSVDDQGSSPTNERTYLVQKDPSFITEYAPVRGTQGTAKYYAHWDHDTMLIAPAPSASITIELAYTYRPLGLSSTTTTTWLGDNAPDALLYASLIEAYTFMKGDPDMLQGYNQEYARAIQALMAEENIRNRSDEFRERSIKIGALPSGASNQPR